MKKSGSSLYPLNILAEAFPLSCSHYVLLISRSRSDEARHFYHADALRGGWSEKTLSATAILTDVADSDRYSRSS